MSTANGVGSRESDIMQRVHNYRARLLEEMAYEHWAPDTKTGIKYCLKWLDTYVLSR